MRWFRGLVIALALLIGCMPLTLAVALLSLPFLRWLEAEYAVEAISHSGPAEWVLYGLYGCLMAIFGLLRCYFRKPG